MMMFVKRKPLSVIVCMHECVEHSNGDNTAIMHAVEQAMWRVYATAIVKQQQQSNATANFWGALTLPVCVPALINLLFNEAWNWLLFYVMLNYIYIVENSI